MSENLNSNYSQKRFDHAKQSAKDALKTSSKWVIQTIAEETSDLVGHKIANKITKKSPQNTSKTVESETEIPKERNI